VAGPSAKLPEFLARLAESPCCAAITSDAYLEAALESAVSTLFILRGDGLELRPLVRRIHAAGKLVAVHVDLVDGLRSDRTAIAWLAGAGVDAVISSHGQLMASVRREQMVGIHRLLLTRCGLLDSGLSAVARSGADIVEVLPGVILPDVRSLLPRLDVPLLAGGFIWTETEARAVLAAGAIGVTTSKPSLWGARLV
jgi:glycerol uptake operon antiterminator